MSFGRQLKVGLLALLVAVVGAGPAVAQDANATITGSVADEQGQVLPGATVTLVNESTKLSRTAVSDGRGDFRFTSLIPGTYTVKVEMQGFKAFERRSNVLNAASTLSLGGIKLALGQLTEVIVVEDSGSKVNVEESQHAGLLTSTQIEQLQSKGRDVVNLLRALPGVAYTDDTESLGDSFGTVMPNISGQRQHWNRLTVDGMNGSESGGGGRMGSAVSLDAISEVKVLLNTYRAEYGGTGGANVQVVTKSGGTDYRGSAYYIARRTGWNANRWENNKSGVSPDNDVADCSRSWTTDNGSTVCSTRRPAYDFNTYGFNIGGPFPGQDEKKLFFFYNVEVPLVNRDGALMRWIVPTELERQGDFSRTFAPGNTTTPVTVLDPLTGTPFPGNRIPADRIDPNMQRLMSLYPLPNATDPGVTRNNYNLLTQRNNDNPRQNHLLRLDWKPGEKDTIYISGRVHNSLQKGVDVPAAPAKWGFYEPVYDFGDGSINIGHTRIFSSSVINEFSAGARRQWENFGTVTESEFDQRLSREGVGITTGQFFPSVNTTRSFEGRPVIPKVILGGVNPTGTTAANFDFPDRLGENVSDYMVAARDNLTWTKDTHTFKGGFNFERWWQNEGQGGDYMGRFSFDNAARTTNPLSSTVTYANMLMGVFRNYSEVDEKRDTANRQSRLEWYVQDTWKASRRLTLDLGVRFLWYQQVYQGGNLLHSAFVPERYVLANAPRMYVAGPGGIAVDPGNPNDRRTPGQSFIGRFVPGTGDVGNGMVLSNDTTYPRGYRDNQGVHPEPRVGFAYDMFGNGKTALHGGFGLAHQGYVGGGYQGNLRGVPASRVINIPNSSTRAFLDSIGFEGPTGVRGVQVDNKTPSAYKASFGVTQEVGWGTTIDVSYVGVLNRHMEMVRNINDIPAGAKLPGTTVIQHEVRPINVINPLTGVRHTDDNQLRPYLGFTDINVHEHWATANYNALQVQLTRRYVKGLQFSMAYTWSKALGVGNNDGDAYTRDMPIERYYSPQTHNQAHNFVTNFTYDFPKASKALGDVAPVRFLFDNWQLSGEFVYASGDWAGINLDMNPNVDFTGGDNCELGGGSNSGCEGGATVVVVGDPRNKGGSPFDAENPWFNPDAFAMPSADNLGNVSRTVIQRPPIQSLNLSAYKNFPLGGRRRLQFRLEGYNVLNHTQIRDIGRTVQFDSRRTLTDGSANPAFGTITNRSSVGLATGNARAPRVLQASLRINF